MSRQPHTKTFTSIIITMMICLLSLSQATTAKPSWKSDSIEESQNTKGSGKGGRNKSGTATDTTDTNDTAAPDNTAVIVIDIQPYSQTVNETESITLNVSASSTDNLHYQWRKNGVAIPDAIHSHFSVNAATETDSGTYDVIISNTSSSLNSDTATLTVKPLSNIALQWQKPEQREDGSPLVESEISSYSIYLSYEGETEEIITVPSSYTSLTLEEMYTGSYQFAIATIDNSGQTGRKSDYLSIEIN